MKNKYLSLLYIVILFFIKQITVYADDLNIKSSSMSVDKVTKIIILNGDVRVIDEKNNQIFAEYARYDKTKGYLQTTGETRIITSEGYKVSGTNFYLDNNKKIISSKNKTLLLDTSGNEVTVEMFNYVINKNLFFSKGDIQVLDVNKNLYNLSEIYIDELKNKIVGSDVKAFLNQDDLKISKNNEPRIFANSIDITKNISKMNKGIFTYCKNRGKDKCPPWTLQSDQIEHSSSKKTIYYKDAILKIYDFPIFYFPIFSHPDPTVKRRSGLLVPTFTNNTNTGAGINIPYFWAISQDKDLTITPKIYGRENPLLMAEYRQAFNNANLFVDTSYNKGLKRKKPSSTSGSRNHFFLDYNQIFIDEGNIKSGLDLKIQRLSHDTYFKINGIQTSLVDQDVSILENTLSYNYEEDDFYFAASTSAFENIKKEGRSRHEYLLPSLSLEKNILTSEEYGLFDLTSNLRVRNYEVDKQTEFFTNDVSWESNKWINNFGLESQVLGLVKTVNYNAKNTSLFKNDDSNAELSGVVGYLTKLGFYKNDYENNFSHLLAPKILMRYAPGHMRKTEVGRLKYSNIYNINKSEEIDVIENGLSTVLGFEYKKNNLDNRGITGTEIASFSVAQVISDEENTDIAPQTSMDQRFSDIVGEANYKINNNVDFKYNFALDQNYKEINYSEIGADFTYKKSELNISYLEEKNHIGSTEYIQSEASYLINNSNKLSFSTKRNILTSSAEFYNLSYEYINDCLRAGLVYRREFYADRDIEPANSLMFKISIVPFAILKGPVVNK